mmetsp:Transcript_77830/g.175984  ORF Transcript_77830/g.175984 Transcript_77830/m.175984 type:complete len:254 (+) Transcript_77830:58-819(+)|eukprot:CAMPEP_0197910764 /NCGR_PEP_ID=MMETSP1439-20131203/71514_1 /TAXON_ID=66791 /ORGANISM="Gonyaulax spinifera, Strain CCMP409" /LENGTH=253 /DNA_ID=CAMNT_0043532447 /DNA_START=52 /DNA_END=813 /DNA_ORIENTATION=-
MQRGLCEGNMPRCRRQRQRVVALAWMAAAAGSTARAIAAAGGLESFIPGLPLKAQVQSVPDALNSATSRRLLLTQGLAVMGGPTAASAIGVAFDYRTLDQIDPSTRVIVGDKSSESARKAIARVADVRNKVVKAQAKIEADPQADVGAEFTYKAPSNPMSANNPTVQELRAASAEIGSLMNEATRADTDRATRIMLSAYFKIITDPAFQMAPPSTPDGVRQVLIRATPEALVRFKGCLAEYVAAADKLLSFVA